MTLREQNSHLRSVLLLAAGLASLSCAVGQGPVAKFGGPDRNGIFHGTGLLESWHDYRFKRKTRVGEEFSFKYVGSMLIEGKPPLPRGVL